MTGHGEQQLCIRYKDRQWSIYLLHNVITDNLDTKAISHFIYLEHEYERTKPLCSLRP